MFYQNRIHLRREFSSGARLFDGVQQQCIQAAPPLSNMRVSFDDFIEVAQHQDQVIMQPGSSFELELDESLYAQQRRIFCVNIVWKRLLVKAEELVIN